MAHHNSQRGINGTLAQLDAENSQRKANRVVISLQQARPSCTDRDGNSPKDIAAGVGNAVALTERSANQKKFSKSIDSLILTILRGHHSTLLNTVNSGLDEESQLYSRLFNKLPIKLSQAQSEIDLDPRPRFLVLDGETRYTLRTVWSKV